MVGSAVLFVTNMRFSVEFTGGMNIRVATQLPADFVQQTQEFLVGVGYPKAEVGAKVSSTYSDISIATDVSDDSAMNTLAQDIKGYLVQHNVVSNDKEILQLSITGPSVWAYMQSAAVRAIVIWLSFLVIYMLFAFATIRKVVPPSILAVVVVVTMFFDIFAPAGAYGILMWINSTIQVNTIFVIAILTTMGYSINDTIIVFDRIRENVEMLWDNGTKNIAKVFEDSLRQTMRRSLMTGGSVILVILSMYVFGTGDMKDFAFTMGIGMISGTYSSIFIAAPLAYLLLRKKKATA